MPQKAVCKLLHEKQGIWQVKAVLMNIGKSEIGEADMFCRAGLKFNVRLTMPLAC